MIGHADTNNFGTPRPVNPQPSGVPLDIVEPGFFVPLIRKIMEDGPAGELGGSFVFTSAMPGEGVSAVVTSVARELAAVSGERVLIADAGDIGNFAPADDPDNHEPVIREGRGLYRLRPQTVANNATRVERFFLLKQLKDLFPFVLVDAPALSASAEALEFGARSRGLVLVAAAGKLRRSRLQLTKRMIDVSGVPLIGCALNRRTYPIPDFLYKRL